MFVAVVRISGAGRIADFRERVRWLMVRDADAEDYTEHHQDGVLEYRFQPRQGIPFPAFAEASGEFPELRVEATWERDGQRGKALIEAGRVVKEETTSEAPGVEVQLGAQGEITLAVVMRRIGDACCGYAADANRHTFFRCSGGALELLDVEQPDQELEALAFGFVDEWLWYDEEEASLERARYADYGFPVRGANLRSQKLAFMRRQGEGRFSTLSAEEQTARDALKAAWLKKD